MMMLSFIVILAAMTSAKASNAEDVYTNLYETSDVEFMNVLGTVTGDIPSYVHGGKLVGANYKLITIGLAERLAVPCTISATVNVVT